MSLMLLEWTAWITDPAPRNSNALKNACVNRWNIAAVATGRPDADIDGDHVRELGDRGVREHLLDVVLHQREERGASSSVIAPMIADDVQRDRVGADEDLERPRDQVDARPRPWSRRGSAPRRASGPPSRRAARRDSGNCARLADRAAEQQERRARSRAASTSSWLVTTSAPITWMLDVVHPGREDQREDAEHERHVADPGRDERLDRRRRSSAWSSYQCPISRYEQTPMTSHPTSSWNRLRRDDRRRASRR